MSGMMVGKRLTLYPIFQTENETRRSNECFTTENQPQSNVAHNQSSSNIECIVYLYYICEQRLTGKRNSEY